MGLIEAVGRVIVPDTLKNFDPRVVDLAMRIAKVKGGIARRHASQISRFIVNWPDVADEVLSKDIPDKDLDVTVIRQYFRRALNRTAGNYHVCTAGAATLEISPNGKYSRCSKMPQVESYIGHSLDDGPFKILDPAVDDLSCNVRCPPLMCFARNVLRAPDRASFQDKLAAQGLKGRYEHGRYAKMPVIPDMFVRWKFTDVCNYTCSYCSDWRTVNKKGAELTDDEILIVGRKILDQFANISMRLTGGEPSTRRSYVGLMKLLHSRLDQITDLEIRTNLSFQKKHAEVLNWDWRGKLHLHVGCHLADKNFMPWRTVALLKEFPQADYVLKFVSTAANEAHVDYFCDYFISQGLPRDRLVVVREVMDQEVEDAPVPFARKFLETDGGRKPQQALQ